MDATWKFDQAPNCAVITLRGIIERCEPVLHVTHDEDDHGWQFLGAGTSLEAETRIVSLEEMLNLDPTLRDLADSQWVGTLGDGISEILGAKHGIHTMEA